MSHAITIDTHFHAKNLKKAGFNDEQIETQLALAQSQTDFINNNLATKHDIELIRKDLEHGISKLESRITTKLVAITVIIPTILKILEHLKI